MQLDNKFEWDKTECKSNCSWFGFKVLIKDESGIDREDLLDFLNKM